MATSVAAHYDGVAADYHKQYRRSELFLNADYPANYFRLQSLVTSFIQKGIRRVLEVGVGEGTPLVTLAKTGMDVWGFDLADGMVEQAKQNFAAHGYEPERIGWGDIQDSLTYAHLLERGLFDGLLAMGVMPHVDNDELALANMASCVRPGGSVFIEFRNKLFSLFTFNRYTYEFLLEDLLAGVDPAIKDAVAREIAPRLRLDLPPQRETLAGGSGVGYDAILAKFHNPLEMPALFRRHGFRDVELIWYHYHPALPCLEPALGERFRQEAFRLEHETSGWRGMFLCSAYVVEAVKC